MSTNFPTGLDSFTNPAPGDFQNSPGVLNHATQHDNLNDSVAALETKVGINGSADTASLDYKVSQLSGGNPGSLQGQVFIPASATSGTAINAAMTANPNGVTIILGAGNHTINTAVLISCNATIRGVNRLATTLVWDTSAVPTAIKMVDTANRRIQLRDFSMFCTNPGAGCGVDATYFVDSTLDNLFIGTNSANSPLVGIDFSNGGGGITYYNVVSNCRIAATGVSPITIKFGNGSNSNTVIYTRVLNIATGTGSGVQVAGTATSSILLSHIDMESNPNTIGFDIGANATDIMIFEPYVEGLNTGLKIAAGASFVKAYGGKFQGNTTDISDLGGNGTSIQDVRTGAANVLTGQRTNPNGTAIVFNASGSLTAAQVQGAYALRVRCVGGGGAGGGAANSVNGTSASHGGGGAGGQYAESLIQTSTITFPVTITVGAAGTGGAGAGGNGGDSSFAATVIGKGGAGGAAGAAVGASNLSAAGSNPTTGGTGQILQDGNAGMPGFVLAVGAGAGIALGGNGGASGMGGGGTYSRTGNATSVGQNASANTGGGGGGAVSVNAGGAANGGNGGSGIVIVEPLFG